MNTNPSKILTALALAALLSSGAHALAQGGPTPSPTPSATPATPAAMEKPEHPSKEARGPRGDNQLERLTKELSLTPEQVEKIKVILASQREKMRALREDKSATPETNRPKAQEIRANSKKEIDAVLTPEQKTKFDGMRQRAAGRGEGKMERMKAHDEMSPAPSPTP